MRIKRLSKLLTLLWVMLVSIDITMDAQAATIEKGDLNASIGAGESFSAVIKSDGSLWTWGSNGYGQLGNGSTDREDNPVMIMKDVISVSVGSEHAVAIKADNSLWAWGSNLYGQLGNGGVGDRYNGYYGGYYQTSPIKVMDDVIAVSAGGEQTAAITTDGTLWMWGSSFSDFERIKVMENVSAVSASTNFLAFITTDGSLWTMGSNKYGQLGNGDIDISSGNPIKIMDSVKAVSTSGDHVAAIKDDGTLWTWGSNRSGKLGYGKASDLAIPTKVMDDVIYVDTSWGCTAAIKRDGSLWLWGANNCGQLGNGEKKNSNIPIKIMEDVIAVSCSQYTADHSAHTLAEKKDGSLWAWGANKSFNISSRITDQISAEGSTTPIRIMEGIALSGAGRTTANATEIDESSLYIYDTLDLGADVILNTYMLNGVIDLSSATSAVQSQAQSMTSAQKASATGADLATLYAETAVAKAASTTVSGTDILINKAAVTELEAIAKQTSAAVETALVSGGVATARYLSNTVTLVTEETGEISIRIDPDILTTEVDKIVVEAPTYAITLKVDDLKEDLTEILTITAQDVGSGFGLGDNKKTTVKVNLPNGKTSNPVTLSLPKDSGDTTYQAVVSTSGTATSSKYNPATTTMDGKVSTSGSYTVKTNQKDFSDIANKSAEMQNAIRYLASKGIINGTDATHFSPDGSITRAEIAALMVRALGKLDNSAKPTFKDVTTSNWYYATAASSQKAGLINGYEDNTFRGGNQILKEQIVAVSARVLTNEMGYKTPTNPSSYLSKYSDSVVSWAQPEVALATRENLVVYRTDGTFSGSKGMTRGDAAIIIYRLFQKIW